MRAVTTCAGIVIVSSFCLATMGCDPQVPVNSTASQRSSVADESLKITEIRVGDEVRDSRQPAPKPLTTTDPVVVSLKTTGASKGTQLEAKLFNLSGGQAVAMQTKKIVADGPATTELTFKSESGWVAGRHLLEVKLDGKLAEQRDVDIIDLPPESSTK